MQKIYAVGVLQLEAAEQSIVFARIKSQRLWALFAKFEDAERCILENQGDIFEYYYNYALIEEIVLIDESARDDTNSEYGIPRQWWYQADYSADLGQRDIHKIIKVAVPKCCEHICNFWIG